MSVSGAGAVDEDGCGRHNGCCCRCGDCDVELAAGLRRRRRRGGLITEDFSCVTRRCRTSSPCSVTSRHVNDAFSCVMTHPSARNDSLRTHPSERKCAENYSKLHSVFTFFETAICILVISNHNSFPVLLNKFASGNENLYFIRMNISGSKTNGK